MFAGELRWWPREVLQFRIRHTLGQIFDDIIIESYEDFKRLINASSLSTKSQVLIDGLREFKGDHAIDHIIDRREGEIRKGRGVLN